MLERNICPKGFLIKIKGWLKTNRNSHNPAIRLLVRTLYKIYAPIRMAKGLISSKQKRAVFYTKLLRRNRVHQTTPATAMNRYPVIFSACKEYFKNRKDIKILSFGCATGEEVITLRYYFPDATIIGAEVNKYCLEVCNRRRLDEKMIFIDSTDEEIASNGPYDAIFCMAVFQRTPEQITLDGVKNIKRIYPFAKFEKQVCKLDQQLNENGLLVVHYSQYDFADTRISGYYEAYGDYGQEDYRCSVFDKNGHRIERPWKRHTIFVKLSEQSKYD